MKIVQLTTDNRNQFGRYDLPAPYFGTAPTALLEGFASIPEAEVHVISCASTRMVVPEKLAPNVHFHQPFVPKWGWGRTFFLGCVLRTRALIRSLRPDIVHGQGSERDCAMEAVLSGFPNVLTLHGNMRVHAARPDNGNPRYYRMAAKLEAFCLARTDGVVAISRYTRDLVADATARTWLLPNAVDSRFFSVEPQVGGVPRILFVGTINERKNPLALLRVCRELLLAGRCTLAFAGDGSAESQYCKEFKREADGLPGVELLGFIGREALLSEFAKSSLLVLPTYEDNCPMVVLEAMAAGLPVAASHVGGVPDLIDEGVQGLMFAPDDPTAIRAAVEKLVTDAAFRRDAGEAGRRKAQAEFHPVRIAQRHMEIYREVLAGGSSHPPFAR